MRRSPRALLALVLACVLAAGPTAGAASASTTAPAAVREFTISGTGYGHGIGMSQYGAQGYAIKGYSHSQILAHYYQGTTLKTFKQLYGSGYTDNPSVKVNIDKSRSSRSSWTLKGNGSQMVVSSGSTALTLASNTYYKFTASSGKVVVNGKTLGSSATVSAASGSPKLIVVKSSSGPFAYEYVRYRGKIVLTASGGNLKAVNVVPMESYLYGVVPRESPASWKPEALKAQAVAARSYAWGCNPDADRNKTLDGELACTTASQVYGGHSRLKSGTTVYMHEQSSTNGAVNDTAGKVVYHASTGKVVTAYFFSQSGGRTANIEDVWTSATPRPYYKSVSDPYENVAGANYCPWPSSKEKHLDGAEMADKLRDYGVSGVPGGSAHVVGVSTERPSSGYPKYVTFRFSNGSSVKTTGWTVRSAFGLLSPMFYFSGFPISRIYGGDRYGTAVQVSKSAFSGTAPAVVIASGEDFADALTGSALAGAAGGSLLLARHDGLPPESAQELARLAPARVYLMGSTRALSRSVGTAAQRIVPGAVVERLSGADRYETAEKAAAAIRALIPAPAAGANKVLLASGTSWPDAAAASALAYARAYPILLTRRDALSGPSRRALASLRPEDTIVVGSTKVVGDAVRTAAQSAAGGAASRIQGSDRYATSAALARYLTGSGSPEGTWSCDAVYLATGGAFPDALSGGILAGKLRRPMLLTKKYGISSATARFLEDNRSKIEKLWIFGSTSAVTPSGFAALDAAMLN